MTTIQSHSYRAVMSASQSSSMPLVSAQRTIDMHTLLLAHAASLMEASGADAKEKIDSMRLRQSHGREARDVANQIETLINKLGTSTTDTTAVGKGIRDFFDKHGISITVYEDGTRKTMMAWENRTGPGEPEGGNGNYNAAHLRSLKAAAEAEGEAATDSRTIENIEINKFLQEYNGVSTLANTIISSRGQQLNQINGSMRS